MCRFLLYVLFLYFRKETRQEHVQPAAVYLGELSINAAKHGQQLGRLCPEMFAGRDQELLSLPVNVTVSTKLHALHAACIRRKPCLMEIVCFRTSGQFGPRCSLGRMDYSMLLYKAVCFSMSTTGVKEMWPEAHRRSLCRTGIVKSFIDK